MSAVCNVAWDELLDYVEDRIASARRAEVEAHLEQGCRSCQRDLTWLRSVAACMRSDDSREPPTWVKRRAVNLFKQYGPRPRPTLLERIAAALVFDNGLQPQLAGVRGATAAPSRQMLFTAGDIDVDVRTEPTEEQDKVTLIGQVLPQSAGAVSLGGVEVHLLHARRDLFSKMTDELGEFTIGRLPHGRYRLLIRLPDKEIEIPGIEI